MNLIDGFIFFYFLGLRSTGVGTCLIWLNELVFNPFRLVFLSNLNRVCGFGYVSLIDKCGEDPILP